MPINRIKKSVASRIASCKSKTIPARLLHWAQKHVEALAGTSSSTADGSSPRSTGSSPAAERISSVSSVPFLELTLDETKLSARSCLKKKRRGPNHGADADAGPATKHVGFVCNDRLLRCMVTGTHIPFRARTAKMTEEFNQRAVDRTEQRRINRLAHRLAREAAGIPPGETSSSSSSSDDDDVQPKWDSYSSDESDELLYDPDSVADMSLRENHELAKLAKEALTVGTIAGGGMDFALYVVRDEDLLRALERTAEKYAHHTRIASYCGDERRYAYCGVGSITELSVQLYSNYATAMSGNRTLRPVAPKQKKKKSADAVVATAAASSSKVEGSSMTKSFPRAESSSMAERRLANSQKQVTVATLAAIAEVNSEANSEVNAEANNTEVNTEAVTEAITEANTTV
ncbi:hypothetical protein LMH87_007410 [Akanthomyces muscarius]|uniref:Uncharacterized protein n=1 Tax=Akanthomyces muscarius TaxID=2231603 RepID=A0A9W8QQS4_AKAMU|nr:hypothetical protein LMH87_007410 [Akanthomyces muscarius]KAJ4165795.1 hypothetical protein LMH87_007410 [Akanthomyces muscarius]